ncbi:MAG: hypothetical protein AB7I36_19065 [Rhodospirillaceae bacterium]
MEFDDWRATVGQIYDDIAGILRAQRVRGDIEEQLRARDARPLEDDAIFEVGLGQHPGTPRIVEIDGVTISIRILHRRGLGVRDIKGADLLYEIAGRKYMLIQYKTPDARGMVTKDGDQLRELIAACPNPCPPPRRGLWPTCGSWFALTAPERLYLPACVADSIFGVAASRTAKKFRSGVPQETFDHLFARCWIGARVAPTEFAYLTWSELDADRVLFSVVQSGTL